jgi:hypothetical protein
MQLLKLGLRSAGRGLILVCVMGLASCANNMTAASKSVSADQATVNKLLQQAYSQTLSKNDSAAELLLLQAQKLAPANPWVALNLGAVYQRNGHKELALKQYQKVLDLPEAEEPGQVSAGQTAGASPSSIARANVKQMELLTVARKRVTFGEGAPPSAVAPAEPLQPMDSKVIAAVSTGISPATTSSNGSVEPAGDQKRQLNVFLNSWRTAWEGLDLNAYLGHYQSSFKGDKSTREAWLANRQKAFARNAKGVKVQILDPIIKINGLEAEISFKQKFESSVFSDSGVKVLKLVQSDGQWRINQETFFN